MATIAGITGLQFSQGTEAYEDEKYQYASSSHEIDHDMNPGLIVQPRNNADIALTLQYARSKKIAVAIRSGGHQYSGASSTGAPNIQLDLRNTFRNPDDKTIIEKDDRSYIRTSVSWSLGEFNAYLGDHKFFVPHGQCTAVHVGGHVQTGGYGQLGRSFGLFGDHVISFEIVDYEGNSKEVTKTSDPELFYAFLGGSPGNLGVLTHFTIEVHRDGDYQGSKGLKGLYWYKPETLNRLMDILVKMSDDGNWPRNYDLCVSVLSSSFPLLDLWPDIDNKMRIEHPEIYGENGIPAWPRMIIIYAQYVPFSPTDTCDPTFFSQLEHLDCISVAGVQEKPMSELTAEWIFRNTREFQHPYVKRTYSTDSTSLGASGWAEWVTGRIDELVKPDENRCWLSAQLQYFGGKNSMFTANAGNGTAYSWRDSTIICTIDAFHEPQTKARAEAWEKVNDEEGIGAEGRFSKRDRRLLWGSYGEYDMDKVWDCYFEDREKYERIGRVRGRVDPEGVFSPNPFAVKRIM